MMRYFLIVVFTISFHSIFAQNINYSLSGEIVMRNTDEYQGLLRSDSTGYTLHIYERGGKGLLGFPGRNLILEKYDKNFNQIFSYEYGRESDKPQISTELVALGDYYIWIVMEKIGSYNYQYSMVPISLDGKLGKKEFLFTNEVEKYGDLPTTYTRLSPDSTKMAFFATFDDDRKKQSTEVFSTVIDSKANILWDKFTKLRGNQKQYTITDYQVSNEGEVFFVSKVYKNDKGKDKVKNRRKEEIAGYDMTIFKVNGQKDTKLLKEKIELEGAFVSETKLKLNKQSELVCSGFTTSKNKGNISGVFYAKLDADLNFIDQKSRQFTTDELIRLSKADAEVNLKRKDKQGLDDAFELVEIITADDGSSYIVAEQNYVRNYVNNNANFGPVYGSNIGNSGRSNNLTVYSNDIVVISLLANGDIEEVELLPKKQNASFYYGNSFYNISDERLREVDYFLSYSSMIKDDKNYFFYNEHEDNLESDRGKRRSVNNPRNMRSVMSYFTPEGQKYELVLKRFSEDLIISPTRSKQISENEFFFTAVQARTRKNSIIRIGIITMD